MKIKYWIKFQNHPVTAILERNNSLEILKGIFKWDKQIMKIGEHEFQPNQIRNIRHWQAEEDLLYMEQMLFALKEMKKEKRSKVFFNSILEDSFI